MKVSALLAALCLVLMPCGTSAEESVYRWTPYAHDGRFLERAIARGGRRPTPALQRVFGGVVTHHIPNGMPLIADFYGRLAKSVTVDTFVILGPDHYERGGSPVTVSRAQYATPFGTLNPDGGLIDALEHAGVVVHDETAFNDHAVHSQVLAIALMFPHARIVPILIRSRTRNSEALELGRAIAQHAGPRTFVVGSVDFSHYLSTDRALPLDRHAASTLATLRPELAGVAEADSPQALTAMIAAVVAMGADRTEEIGVYNSDPYSGGRSEVTTGYVLQYYGTDLRRSVVASDWLAR